MPRTTRGCIGIGLLTFLLAASSLAHAQAPRGGVDPKRRAEITFREGSELAKAGKTEAALGKFEESYSLAPTGAAAFQIGRMEQILGRHALALQHLREALRDASLATDLRRDAEKAVEELKTKVGVLTFDVPDGAAVMVDGNDVDPKTTLEVVPGLHVVKVRLGGEVKSVDVDASAGAVSPVKVRFGDEGPGGPSPPRPPPPATEPAPASGGWSPARIAVVSGLGAGAIGLGVLSFVFYSSASGARDDAKALLGGGSCVGVTNDACRRAAELREDHDAAGTWSTVTFVGAAALGVGAIAAIVLWPKSDKAAARVTPLAAPGFGGLRLDAPF